VILEVRERPSTGWALMSPALAVSAALLVSAVLVVASGASVVPAFEALVRGAFGSKFALLETLVVATPLMFTGLSVAIAFKARLYNIGAEGQLYAGALAAAAVATGKLGLPEGLFLPLALVAGFLGAGAVLVGPAMLKTRFQVDEVVTTLLLNFIILLVVSLIVLGPWKDPLFASASVPVLEGARLPRFTGTRLGYGIVLAVAAALLLWIVIQRTGLGYRIQAIGSNRRAAEFHGISTTRTILAAALISGGLAGLAGACQLLGSTYRLSEGLAVGYGYAGIAVALLARLNPLGVVGAAVFFAAVKTGSDNLAREFAVPPALADVIQGLALLFMLAALVLVNFRVRRD
jgi:general nucleoside transport system permease protein